MITYSIATEEDIDKLKQLTDLMLTHTSLGVATVPKITALVQSPNTLVTLAWADQKLVGFSCAAVHESMFNNLKRVSDIGLFVDKEYRKSEIAAVLIELLEAWAQKQGASQIWLGQTTGDNVAIVERYYNRLGYKTQGFNCVKEL
jgi:GNAT superfamily N-acetyltransferase